MRWLACLGLIIVSLPVSAQAGWTMRADTVARGASVVTYDQTRPLGPEAAWWYDPAEVDCLRRWDDQTTQVRAVSADGGCVYLGHATGRHWFLSTDDAAVWFDGPDQPPSSLHQGVVFRSGETVFALIGNPRERYAVWRWVPGASPDSAGSQPERIWSSPTGRYSGYVPVLVPAPGGAFLFGDLAGDESRSVRRIGADGSTLWERSLGREVVRGASWYTSGYPLHVAPVDGGEGGVLVGGMTSVDVTRSDGQVTSAHRYMTTGLVSVGPNGVVRWAINLPGDAGPVAAFDDGSALLIQQQAAEAVAVDDARRRRVRSWHVEPTWIDARGRVQGRTPFRSEAYVSRVRLTARGVDLRMVVDRPGRRHGDLVIVHLERDGTAGPPAVADPPAGDARR